MLRLLVLVPMHFNSRSHEESDVPVELGNFPDGEFQFTLSRRERLSPSTSMILRLNFNSRSHEESDPSLCICLSKQSYFNSRSHEESDESRSGKISTINNFNSRSHEESDERTSSLSGWNSISIHALTKRATS